MRGNIRIAICHRFVVWLLYKEKAGPHTVPGYCRGSFCIHADHCDVFCYVRTAYQIRIYKSRPNFKPPVTFNWDYALMQTNMYSFILFVVFWLPFGVVLAVGTVRRIPDGLFYNLAWLAICKSCINSILYCVVNRHFRAAYVNLFHYCCCKTTVSFSRRQRPEGIRPSGDVRVHIIPGYNMYCSPQRGREGPRCSGRTNGRDVYELWWGESCSSGKGIWI